MSNHVQSSVRFVLFSLISLPYPDELLSFWFGVNPDSQSPFVHPPPNDVAYIKTRMPLWFGKNDEFELKQKEIADSYLEIIASWETSVTGEYQTIYEAWNSPNGYLARIILFSQIPRAAFRTTPRAFAYDSIAAKYALLIVEDVNLWCQYIAVERFFVIICFHHTEDIAMQEKAAALTAIMTTEENEEIQEYFKNFKSFYSEHREVILRFGRFPGRNKVLASEKLLLE